MKYTTPEERKKAIINYLSDNTSYCAAAVKPTPLIVYEGNNKEHGGHYYNVYNPLTGQKFINKANIKGTIFKASKWGDASQNGINVIYCTPKTYTPTKEIITMNYSEEYELLDIVVLSIRTARASRGVNTDIRTFRTLYRVFLFEGDFRPYGSSGDRIWEDKDGKFYNHTLLSKLNEASVYYTGTKEITYDGWNKFAVASGMEELYTRIGSLWGLYTAYKNMMPRAVSKEAQAKAAKRSKEEKAVLAISEDSFKSKEDILKEITLRGLKQEREVYSFSSPSKKAMRTETSVEHMFLYAEKIKDRLCLRTFIVNDIYTIENDINKDMTIGYKYFELGDSYSTTCSERSRIFINVDGKITSIIKGYSTGKFDKIEDVRYTKYFKGLIKNPEVLETFELTKGKSEIFKDTFEYDMSKSTLDIYRISAEPSLRKLLGVIKKEASHELFDAGYKNIYNLLYYSDSFNQATYFITGKSFNIPKTKKTLFEKLQLNEHQLQKYNEALTVKTENDIYHGGNINFLRALESIRILTGKAKVNGIESTNPYLKDMDNDKFDKYFDIMKLLEEENIMSTYLPYLLKLLTYKKSVLPSRVYYHSWFASDKNMSDYSLPLVEKFFDNLKLETTEDKTLFKNIMKMLLNEINNPDYIPQVGALELNTTEKLKEYEHKLRVNIGNCSVRKPATYL